MSDIASSPSRVRVFGKSMHLLAAGWVVSIAWLWVAGVRQEILRSGGPPANYAMATLIPGLIPAALIALCGIAIERWSGPAPTQTLQTREWWHGFWWALFPNLQLLFTVWMMIRDGR
jgi:hypothetical protein